ncbi:MAG TPA: hypothetical protein VGK64_31370 [Bryobacteraceae bacterium]
MLYLIRNSAWILAVIFASVGTLNAQSTEFKIEGRPIQVHGFASQGFAISDGNNFLTMNTREGSFALTDFGVNISIEITPKLRLGAQLYNRNIGHLGNWHPELDWAGVDYKFKDWLGIRAGKVKTVLGLYNDTRDMEFLHTWAILPQSMYPLDLRASDMAHLGGDLYGTVGLKRLGSLAYTGYLGFEPTDLYGGYIYGLKGLGANITAFNRTLQGGDLRWNTPVQGLLAGVSYMNQTVHGRGTNQLGLPSDSKTTKNQTPQFYIQYQRSALKLEGEYRRNLQKVLIFDVLAPPELLVDSRSFYGAATYRLGKRVEIGGYYSRFYLDWADKHSDLGNHIFDKVACIRFDLASHWDLKIEGHFMNGYGASEAFRSFYPQDNPQGFKPGTNLLVLRTGFQF